LNCAATITHFGIQAWEKTRKDLEVEVRENIGREFFYDEAPGFVGLTNSDHASFAYIRADKDDLDPTILHVGTIDVDKSYRGKQISKLLLAKILLSYPETREIRTYLEDDNNLVYRNALVDDLSTLDAVRETPAYKIRNALGFGQIKAFREVNHQKLFLSVTP
ncbi:MAG: hypothetical protein V4692_04255, partial [Bdellovibrionota bacterium]